ncbi:hypothetical protein [Holophaga foetida]|uniref:hypothetical protein n=1 Tax=Holophaga foetida TaxID=35839 RepID=UPI0002471C1B|nr:hypothetical protein [Holophaga foetida]
MPPLSELLQGSCFYPASGTDIRPILALHGRVRTFVYADYWSEVQREFPKIVGALAIEGFTHLGGDELRPGDLWPDRQAWPASFHRASHPEAFRGFWDVEPWGVWMRFGGPLGKVDLLMLGTEGIAAYRELYVASGIAPTWLALLRPGCGLGGGWTDFWTDAPFPEAFRANPGGLPLGILCDDYRPYPPTNLGIPYREVPLASRRNLSGSVQAFRRVPGQTSRERGLSLEELILGLEG